MLSFQWNALRVGDRVLVHDDNDPNLTLHSGTVAIVESRKRAANDVAIRVDGRVRRVRRHGVHLVPFDQTGCWRCTSDSTTSGGQREDLEYLVALPSFEPAKQTQRVTRASSTT